METLFHFFGHTDVKYVIQLARWELVLDKFVQCCVQLLLIWEEIPWKVVFKTLSGNCKNCSGWFVFVSTNML